MNITIIGTGYVGTADKVSAVIRAELAQRGLSDLGFSVVSNPEFLKEGAAVEDFTRPDRIVLGVDDARISFMNELANLAEQVGADIELVRQGIGSDPRIGYSFLYAGAGYGGSCFPKDVQAQLPQHGQGDMKKLRVSVAALLTQHLSQP